MQDKEEQIGYEELVHTLIQETRLGNLEWERIRGKGHIAALYLGKYVKVYDDKPHIVGIDNDFKFTADNARDLYRAVQDYLRPESFDEWADRAVNGIDINLDIESKIESPQHEREEP